jgi:hypothetical protein
MGKQSILYHTKGYQTKLTEFTSADTILSIKLLADGSQEDANLIYLNFSGFNAQDISFSLYLNDGINDYLIERVTIKIGETINLLKNLKTALLDTNGNYYFPLSAGVSLMGKLNNPLTSPDKITVSAITEVF